MSTLQGILGISDVSTFVRTIGQAEVWNAVQQVVDMHRMELAEMSSIFVQEETTVFKERYYLPATGMMQEMDENGTPDAIKATGSYDVAYDLRRFGDAMAWNRVTYAYMTVQQLEAQLTSVLQRATNTTRFQILKHLLNKTNDTFVDKLRGSLTIARLANADGTNYPPVLGSSAETTSHSHYAGTNYASSSISDTNNPIVTIRDTLREHFGRGKVVAFINPAERAKIEALTAFAVLPRLWEIPGANITTSAPTGYDNVPGQIIGMVDDVAISLWDWMPSAYIFGLDLNQPGPLKRRVDEAADLRGFKLVAKDEEHPFTTSFWELNEGYGVGNRLNGAALQLVASTTYTTPSTYA